MGEVEIIIGLCRKLDAAYMDCPLKDVDDSLFAEIDSDVVWEGEGEYEYTKEDFKKVLINLLNVVTTRYKKRNKFKVKNKFEISKAIKGLRTIEENILAIKENLGIADGVEELLEEL